MERRAASSLAMSMHLRVRRRDHAGDKLPTPQQLRDLADRRAALAGCAGEKGIVGHAARRHVAVEACPHCNISCTRERIAKILSRSRMRSLKAPSPTEGSTICCAAHSAYG